jgi:lambda repressor-like predicted transcriptional regulator
MNKLLEAAKDGRWDDVKAFFEENDHYTVYELSIKIGKSPSTIRNWRRKAGLSKKYPFKDRPVTKSMNLPKVDDKEVWDNEEWFKEQYEKNKLGIKAISNMISKSPRLVALRLVKYGIETRSHSEAVKSTNPCSSVEWLMYHYADRHEYLEWAKKGNIELEKGGGKGWSLKKCSEMAGVVPATIYNWLVRANNEGHVINIRDLNESMAGEKNPFFGRKHTKETIEILREKAKSGNSKSRTASGDKKTKTE